ncbi:DUF2029 domain-containing protein [Nocardia panacis]|uniref:DUF2029 domain-containing protein n=1 Tax=Nocardia panacis TaxID=2340916 RepID=A0A3A4KMB1_9NOCA|nr:glycosyltransferase 87 family protein [Nocardia panacis]RJO75176.1 DUF2029 domain-containing protein [Nocardia panacis]
MTVSGVGTAAESRLRELSWRAVAVALGAGVLALIVQGLVVPYTAAPSFGLLVNQADLAIYRQAAEVVLNGRELYTASVGDGWFTYTPFAALLLTPLALIPLGSAQLVWAALSLLAVWVTIRQSALALGYAPGSRLGWWCVGLAAVAVDLEAVRATLWQGQINLILMGLVVADLARPESARWRGWAVGVVAGIKLTAIVFVPYLLVTRQWKAAGIACGSGTVTFLLGAAVLPGDSREYWLHAVREVRRIGPVGHPGNQSLMGVLTNWTHGRLPGSVWFLAAMLLLAAGLLAARWVRDGGNEILALALVGMAGCVISPMAWFHHWVWFVPLLVVLVDRAWRIGEWWWAALGSTLVVASMWMFSWAYIEVVRIGATGLSLYDATDAATDPMPRWMKVFTCGVPVLCYAVVVAGVWWMWLRQRNARTVAV